MIYRGRPGSQQLEMRSEMKFATVNYILCFTLYYFVHAVTLFKLGTLKTSKTKHKNMK